MGSNTIIQSTRRSSSVPGSGDGSLDSYDGHFRTEDDKPSRVLSSLDRPHTRVSIVSYPDGDMEITGCHVFPSSTEKAPEPSTQEEKDKRASSRARKEVFQTAKFFQLDRLWTLNYRGKQSSRSRVKIDWKRYLRLVREDYPQFEALMVPELHTGGGVNDGGYHLHFAVKGFYDVAVLRRCWYAVVGFNDEGKPMGQVDVSPGNSHQQGFRKIANYISKYIVKDIEGHQRKKGEHYYFKTEGLQVPVQKSIKFHGSTSTREKHFYFHLLFVTGKTPKVWHSEDGMQFRFSTFG